MGNANILWFAQAVDDSGEFGMFKLMHTEGTATERARDATGKGRPAEVGTGSGNGDVEARRRGGRSEMEGVGRSGVLCRDDGRHGAGG